MQTTKPAAAALLSSGVASVLPLAGAAATAPSVDDLLAGLRGADDAVRGAAWQGAAGHGAPAAKPLAALMADENFEVARAARRALWVIVRHAGRPGAAKEAAAVARELIGLLPAGPVAVRREILWMLSEIGSDDAIAPISALLNHPDLRDDACAALMRLPGWRATGALKAALSQVPEEFRFTMADSLRKRGETVKGYPSRKLIPTRPTTVTAPPPG